MPQVQTPRSQHEFAPQPTLALEPGQAVPLSVVINVVALRWARAVSDGAMSTQTNEKLVVLVQRFERFAAAHDVTAIGEVDRDLVMKFVATRGRSRSGEVANAAVATRQNRRSALRALYRTARQAGLLIDDPTSCIELPRRDPSEQRPVTADEAALIRLFAQREHPTRHAATAALLLAGAHTAELGHITTADVDLRLRRVRAHGASKHRPRILPLDSWSATVLGQRISYLTRPLTPTGQPPVICTGAEGSEAHKQARVCVTVREILTRAGLSDDPTIRPSSLTAYAARQAFDRTGLIEAAAIVLGAHSLDTTATLIGHHWR